jgi:hypothetical protein
VTRREQIRAEIERRLDIASDDELRVVHFIVERLLGLGRVAYGALDLSTDRRNFERELDEELADALVYVACAVLRHAVGG